MKKWNEPKLMIQKFVLEILYLYRRHRLSCENDRGLLIIENVYLWDQHKFFSFFLFKKTCSIVILHNFDNERTSELGIKAQFTITIVLM